MTLLSLMSQVARTVRHRRAVQSMTELDDRALADIGLLRTDVHAALAHPYFADPSKVLKDACCHWQAFTTRFSASSKPLPCC